jgi:hypothetical protein
MARIKCVLNERRLAYKQAVELYDTQHSGTAQDALALATESADSMFEEALVTEKLEEPVTQRA